MYTSLSKNIAGRFPALRDTLLAFGVSGILRQSALVMYDRSTYSLWTQEGLAIAGPLKGARLRPLSSQRVPWAEWLDQYPGTLVMAPPARGETPEKK